MKTLAVCPAQTRMHARCVQRHVVHAQAHNLPAMRTTPAMHNINALPIRARQSTNALTAVLAMQGVTHIKYCTDGVLLREMMEDPLLTSYRSERCH